MTGLFTGISRGLQLLPAFSNIAPCAKTCMDSSEDHRLEKPRGRRHCQSFVGYCQSEDVTVLPFYDEANEHFILEDIQLRKGNTCSVRQTKVTIDGNEEKICYKIAPCKGVEQCEESDCTYITSTRENIRKQNSSLLDTVQLIFIMFGRLIQMIKGDGLEDWCVQPACYPRIFIIIPAIKNSSESRS